MSCDHYRLLAAGRDCVSAFKSLLELVKQIAVSPTPENKAKLSAYSKNVATAVGEVVHGAEKLKSKLIVASYLRQGSV